MRKAVSHAGSWALRRARPLSALQPTRTHWKNGAGRSMYASGSLSCWITGASLRQASLSLATGTIRIVSGRERRGFVFQLAANSESATAPHAPGPLSYRLHKDKQSQPHITASKTSRALATQPAEKAFPAKSRNFLLLGSARRWRSASQNPWTRKASSPFKRRPSLRSHTSAPGVKQQVLPVARPTRRAVWETSKHCSASVHSTVFSIRKMISARLRPSCASHGNASGGQSNPASL